MAAKPIVFVGSSILQQWQDLLANIRGIPVINKAVGGTRTWEIHDIIADDVLPHNPRMLCYYGGSNDINSGELPGDIIQRTVDTIGWVFAQDAEIAFVYFSIIRAPQKLDRWNDVEEVNASVEQLAVRLPRLHFLDVNPVFVNTNGNPRHELFVEDGLHLTAEAYQALGLLVYPALGHLLKPN